MRTRLLAFLLAIACLIAPGAARATFIIVNIDSPGEGFNDPTPAAPVGGNPGTTVGDQRLKVFEKAGQIWDAILNSPVPIRVQAAFDPLSCGPTSGVLGSAGPYVVDYGFSGAGYPMTWYAGAEANRLAGTDIEPLYDDIFAQFNSDVGTAGCLTSRAWYYGFDGNEGALGIDLLPVLLHEFGHGLGFLTLTDETTGDYFGGVPTIFDRYLYDTTIGKHWIDMTSAERMASGINTTHLVWDGPAVNANAPRKLGKRAHVVTSGALTGDFVSGQGVFSTPLTLAGVTGDVVLVDDGVGVATDGCDTPFLNAASVAGKVALLDRNGVCTIAQQARNAQDNGAIAAIIINNISGPELQLRGASPTTTIPVASLSLADGTALRTALGSGTVHATLALDATHLAGADDAGHVMMYAPNPDQPGSSVSHWDVAGFPNLLMEPSINPDLSQNVDLAFDAFFDIGWFPQLVGVPATEPAALAFSQAPNPMREGGTLRFRLPQQRRVEIALFDVIGRRVVRLANAVMPAGENAVHWARRNDRGHRVGPGVYLARLKSGEIERTLSIVLVD